MTRAFYAAAFIGVFGSIAAIVLGYLDYGLLGISFADSLEKVRKWPIFSLAILLTSLSLAVPFVSHFFRGRATPETCIAGYAIGYLWLPFFMFYPGTRALGVVSDGAAGYVWSAVCVAQYLAAKIMLKAISAQAARDTA